MSTEVEFTDRYGGNTPSWLRTCHGDCEAMGVVPITYDSALRDRKHRQYYVDAWREAEVNKQSDDGWHFVKCPECHGTGRVSWWITIARIPGWFWKGLQFLRQAPPSRDDLSWWQQFRIKVWCAWGADLQRLFK